MTALLANQSDVLGPHILVGDNILFTKKQLSSFPEPLELTLKSRRNEEYNVVITPTTQIDPTTPINEWFYVLNNIIKRVCY